MPSRNEPGTSDASAPDDDQALKKRLLQRAAVAAAVVLGLLGGLVLFDSLTTGPEKEPAQVAKAPETEAKRIAESKPQEMVPEKPVEAEVQKPVEPTEPIAEKPREPAEPAATAEITAAPKGTMPPVRSERPLTVPATPRQAAIRPTEPMAAQKQEPPKDVARALAVPAQRPEPAPHPVARVVESARQFLLQMGVFNNLANAEELRAKLEMAGVPAHVEARVHVGPFATRQEAEQAREKLKALGMEPGVIVATNRK